MQATIGFLGVEHGKGCCAIGALKWRFRDAFLHPHYPKMVQRGVALASTGHAPLASARIAAPVGELTRRHIPVRVAVVL